MPRKKTARDIYERTREERRASNHSLDVTVLDDDTWLVTVYAEVDGKSVLRRSSRVPADKGNRFVANTRKLLVIDDDARVKTRSKADRDVERDAAMAAAGVHGNHE